MNHFLPFHTKVDCVKITLVFCQFTLLKEPAAMLEMKYAVAFECPCRLEQCSFYSLRIWEL